MGAAERNISSLDYLRLMNQLYNDVGQSKVPAENLHQLYLMLKSAHKVKSEDIPANVVTMNSEVTVRYIVSGKTKTIKIVYPPEGVGDNANSDTDDSISVYKPLALSVLGLKEHDLCYSREDNNYTEEPVIIDKILFQPEAHRIFTL
ncbi:MAG: GreA/GreB family elongation factor [Bacteroidales bacterium]|nr:GreA/GreB family elongation factor [Bacteroidales bacterium]